MLTSLSFLGDVTGQLVLRMPPKHLKSEKLKLNEWLLLLNIFMMFKLVDELLVKGEEVVCKTWMRTRVWPLERSVSAAHLRACLLPFLSFSTATATNPFPFPLRWIIDSFAPGSHIYLSIYSSFLFPQLCNFFPNYSFICIVIQRFLLFNIPWLIIKVCISQTGKPFLENHF